MRQLTLTAVALVGDGPLDVIAKDSELLTVDCPLRDDTPQDMLAAYRALPLIVESGGERFCRVSYRWEKGLTHVAYYRKG